MFIVALLPKTLPYYDPCWFIPDYSQCRVARLTHLGDDKSERVEEAHAKTGKADISIALTSAHECMKCVGFFYTFLCTGRLENHNRLKNKDKNLWCGRCFIDAGELGWWVLWLRSAVTHKSKYQRRTMEIRVLCHEFNNPLFIINKGKIMKRVKTVKQNGVRQSMLLAGLILASTGAHAAVLPKITVVGVVGNSLYNVNGYTGSIAYDPSAWFGKPFTLEMAYDATGVVKTTETVNIGGGFTLNTWKPVPVTSSLIIGGVLVFSTTDNRRVEVVNDATLPADLTGLDAPPQMIGGHTYDFFSVEASGVSLACFSGGSNNTCADNEASNVYENAGIVFDYFWDTNIHNALLDANLPNLQNLNFTQGFGGADFNFNHYSPDPNDAFDGNDIARIRLTATSVTVTAVPEPETYAMMLAGLGLVGMMVRRRKYMQS